MEVKGDLLVTRRLPNFVEFWNVNNSHLRLEDNYLFWNCPKLPLVNSFWESLKGGWRGLTAASGLPLPKKDYKKDSGKFNFPLLRYTQAESSHLKVANILIPDHPCDWIMWFYKSLFCRADILPDLMPSPLLLLSAWIKFDLKKVRSIHMTIIISPWYVFPHESKILNK